ncbi:Outer membrane efflux protein BepC [invertebrate metagenome]|uniref:Outer membrane efflux protein BepC n=1 Tax=invertebrate metagenome TaxID=1711999 RepID=A0A2H9T8J0_9ZZZZ
MKITMIPCFIWLFRITATGIAVNYAIQTMAIDAPDSCLSMDHAIIHTLNHHPTLKAAGHQYQSSDAALRASRSYFMPSVDLQTSSGQQKLDTPLTRSAGTSNKPFNPQQLSISASQNLFSGFYHVHEYQKQSEITHMQKEKIRIQAENLAATTATLYIEILNLEKQKAVTDLNLSSHEHIYTLIKQRTQTGLSSQSDLYQIESRLVKAQADKIKTDNQLSTAKIRFHTLTDLQPSGLLLPAPILNLPDTLNDAIKQMLENHPSIRAQEYEVSAAHLGYKQSFSSFLPQIDVSLTRRWDHDISAMRGSHNDIMTMVSVKYNLFSGGCDSARREQLACQSEAVRDSLLDTRQKLIEKLHISWQTLQSLQSQEILFFRQTGFCHKTVIAYRQQYDLGKRSLLDLLNSESEKYQSESSYHHCWFNLLNMRFNIYADMGILLDQLNIPQERWL